MTAQNTTVQRVALVTGSSSGIGAASTGTRVVTHDPGTGVSVVVKVTPNQRQVATPAPAYNTPGDVSRPNVRADAVMGTDAVQPRRLGHVVLGCTDQARSQLLFTDGLGFKISDVVPRRAAFMRCSTDHHNVLIQQAPAAFLHHSSWQGDDVDAIERGATAMLNKDPARHVWGLGRHHIGSNFFWYLRDPARNLSEYYSDLDCIVDDALWHPQEWEGLHGLYNWGTPPPPSFLAPDDLAALMSDVHSGT